MVVSAALASAGCGKQATIALNDGSTVQGRIVESRNHVLVAENEAGARLIISESAVRDITHPGTALAVTGSLLFAVGSTMMLAGALTDCSTRKAEREESAGYGNLFGGCAFEKAVVVAQGAALALPGLGLGIYGIYVFFDSKARAGGARPPEPGAPWAEEWMDPEWSPADAPEFSVRGRF
jgi:hypothetical protein